MHRSVQEHRPVCQTGGKPVGGLVLVALAASVALTTPACRSRERTPEGAIKAFLQAVEVGRLKKVYDMLDPGSQKRLKDLAKQAEDQTGGRHKTKPEQMLVAGMGKARFRPGEMKTLSEGAHVAKVEVHSGDKKHHEVFTLARHDGVWRIVLPIKVLEEMLKTNKGRDQRLPTREGPASRPTGPKSPKIP